jgi:competence protein ComEC
MFFWSSFPFVRISIAFALGIAVSVFLDTYEKILFSISVFCILFLMASTFFSKKWFLKYNWSYGLILVLLSFALGYTRLFLAKEGKRNFDLHSSTQISAYRGKVIDHPIHKGKFYKSTVEVNSLYYINWIPTRYKLNLYVKARSSPFAYGDEILVSGTPINIKGPQNPDEFNYKRYLSFLGVYQQHFADSSSISLLSSGNGNSIIDKSIELRESLSRLLEQHISRPKELAIAKALLLGNKNELDDDIKNTYAASGAMHVLAVSGLHVGIIYLVILYLFKLLPEHYRKPWLVAIISIPLLWSYAFVTGLSPSVLRAVTLFSVIAIGNSMNRQSSIVNMLAVSALILLSFKPYLLMQVGFQLSYIAVLGIIFIYPQIRKLWMPSGRFVIFFWDVTAISIAAQIATFPMSILYFHRFPPYFIVSNLVVIPAATLIVWVGILFFSLSWIGPLASLFGASLAYIIRFINGVLAYIYKLPGSDINSIYLNVPQTWVLYLVIGFLFMFVVYRHKKWANLASICMVLLSILIGARWINNNKLKQITVYNIPYHLSIDLMQSGKIISLMDSLLVDKIDKIHFHINPNRLLNGVSSYKMTEEHAWKQLPIGKALVWNNVSILLVEEKFENQKAPFDIVLSNLDTHKIRIKNSKAEGQNVSEYELKNKGAMVLNLE